MFEVKDLNVLLETLVRLLQPLWNRFLEGAFAHFVSHESGGTVGLSGNSFWPQGLVFHGKVLL